MLSPKNPPPLGVGVSSKRKATVVLINRHTNKDVPLCDTCNHSKEGSAR